MRFRERNASAALGVGLALAVVLTFSGLLVPVSQRAALGASITVTVISGAPTAQRGSAAFGALEDGAILRAGDTVRTGPGTRVVLTYFEGSTVEIEPGSELTIDEASFGEDGATIIRMTQAVGHTWNVVTKLIKAGSRYEIRTPVSTATVRGTEFEVTVAEATGETKVTTTEGAVATSDTAGTTEVVVTRGQETTVKVNQPPAPPKAAPEPARKVSVPLTSNSNSVVTDALGRQNGLRDGKIVLQTPGARIEYTPDGVVVILPNPSDNGLALVARTVTAPAPATTSRPRTTDIPRAASSTFRPNPTSASVPTSAPAASPATVAAQPVVATAHPASSPAPTSTPLPTSAPTRTSAAKNDDPLGAETDLPKATPGPTQKVDPTDQPARAATEKTLAPTAAPADARTAKPEKTVKPTAMPKPTASPKPTPTPKPTNTPRPTRMPRNSDND